MKRFWDKAEHGLAWAVLTGLGLFLFRGRFRAVAGFALFMGVLVEVLQETLPVGRHGDVRDLGADALGVVLALSLWALLGRIARRQP